MHDEETREYEVRFAGSAAAEPSRAREAPQPELPLRPGKRSSRRKLPIAVSLGALIGLTVFWLWDASEAPPEPAVSLAALPAVVPASQPAPVAAGGPEPDVSSAGATAEPPPPEPSVPEVAPSRSDAPPSAEPNTPAGIQIQLLSGRSSDGAERARKRLLEKHGDLLASLAPAVIPADLGPRGVYYRLRAGPLASETQAETICATLAVRKQACIVVREDGS